MQTKPIDIYIKALNAAVVIVNTVLAFITSQFTSFSNFQGCHTTNTFSDTPSYLSEAINWNWDLMMISLLGWHSASTFTFSYIFINHVPDHSSITGIIMIQKNIYRMYAYLSLALYICVWNFLKTDDITVRLYLNITYILPRWHLVFTDSLLFVLYCSHE